MPDSRIVTASWDHTVRIWDRDTGPAQQVIDTGVALNGPCAVAPNHSRIAVSGRDHNLRLIDPSSGKILHILRGHGDWISGCAFAPDGSWLVTSSWDGTVRIWDARTGETRAILAGHAGWVSGCAIAPDGLAVITAGWDGTVRIWDVATGTARKVIDTGAALRDCAIAPDGSWFAAIDTDGIRTWDARTYTPGPAFRTTASGSADRIVIGPGGEIISTSFNQAVPSVIPRGNGDQIDFLRDAVGRPIPMTEGYTGPYAQRIDVTDQEWDAVHAVALHGYGRLLETESTDAELVLSRPIGLGAPVSPSQAAHEGPVGPGKPGRQNSMALLIIGGIVIALIAVVAVLIAVT